MAVQLFSTLAVKKALDEVLFDRFTAETGIKVTGVFDPTVQLLKRIEHGETFDVMIGVTSSFDTLDDVVDLSTRIAVARTGIGLAIPPGNAHPDISTKAALVDTLLRARSVAYSKTGASGIYFADLIERLGIADKINERATVLEKGFIAQTVVDGRADIAVQQLSELRFVPEADIIGPLPDEVQHYTEFSAALSHAAKGNTQASAFVDFLTGPAAAGAYRQTSLETPNA